MKTTLKKTAITFGILIAIFFSSCGSEVKKETTDTEHHEQSDSTAHSTNQTFACPMHPEVIGKESDKCSKCGMALEHNN